MRAQAHALIRTLLICTLSNSALAAGTLALFPLLFLSMTTFASRELGEGDVAEGGGSAETSN